MTANVKRLVMLLLLFPFLQQISAEAAENYELGIRADVKVGSGKPVNDVLGGTLVGRYRLNSNWLVGVAIDHSPEFDIERPLLLMSLAQANEEAQDVVGVSTLISAFAERRYGESNSGGYWFWSVGLGFNSIEADDLSGTLGSGETFSLITDADDETVLFVTGGRTFQLNENWSAGLGARYEHRIADWTITETVSGRTLNIDDYGVSGVFLELNFRF